MVSKLRAGASAKIPSRVATGIALLSVRVTVRMVAASPLAQVPVAVPVISSSSQVSSVPVIWSPSTNR